MWNEVPCSRLAAPGDAPATDISPRLTVKLSEDCQAGTQRNKERGGAALGGAAIPFESKGGEPLHALDIRRVEQCPTILFY